MTNKRSEVRYPAHLKVKSFQYRTVSDIVFNDLMSIDITDLSNSGLGVEMKEPLIVGSVLTLNIHIEGNNYSVITKVKWCEPIDGGYKAGLAIIYLSEELKAKLNILIQEEYLFYN